MAENDRCDKRWVWSEMCGEDYHDTFVDHHEWRRLRQCEVKNEDSSREEGAIFYCIFCLELKTKRLRDGA